MFATSNPKTTSSCGVSETPVSIANVAALKSDFSTDRCSVTKSKMSLPALEISQLPRIPIEARGRPSMKSGFDGTTTPGC